MLNILKHTDTDRLYRFTGILRALDTRRRSRRARVARRGARYIARKRAAVVSTRRYLRQTAKAAMYVWTSFLLLWLGPNWAAEAMASPKLHALNTVPSQPQPTLHIFNPDAPFASSKTPSSPSLPPSSQRPLVLPEISSFNKPAGAAFRPPNLSPLKSLTQLFNNDLASSEDEVDEYEDDDDDDDDDGSSGIGLALLDAGQPRPSPSSPFPQPIVKSLAIYYLQRELKLSEATLMKVVLKHSWVTYLKVR